MIKRIGGSFIDWCREVVESDKYVVLDTETTGLKGEIIDLAIVDIQGNVLYDSLLSPACPIEAQATRVHHIDASMIIDSPCFAEAWISILELIRGKSIIAYNAKFDSGRLAHTANAHNVTLPELTWHCAMLEYAAFYGEPNRYGYFEPAWQKLEEALAQQDILLGPQQHRALWDAQATAILIRTIANLGEKAARYYWHDWHDVERDLKI